MKKLYLAFFLLILAFVPFAALAAVNINAADAAELETLPGIGPAKAEAIIDFRQQNGPFTSAEELAQVNGIGDKTVERLRDQVTVE